jgi:hypothetical protein
MRPAIGGGFVFLDLWRSKATPYVAMKSFDLATECAPRAYFVPSSGPDTYPISGHLEVYADSDRVVDFGLSDLQYDSPSATVSLDDLRVTALLPSAP